MKPNQKPNLKPNLKLNIKPHQKTEFENRIHVLRTTLCSVKTIHSPRSKTSPLVAEPVTRTPEILLRTTPEGARPPAPG